MKLELRPGFVLFVLALYLAAGELTWLFLLAAALHEAAHLLLLWAVGCDVKQLTLRFADAKISMTPLGYGQEIACALAGPAANLLLFCGFRSNQAEFAAINLLVGCYNLLPVPVLDGGRALGAALSLLLPQQAAQRICALVGVLTCAALLAGGAFAMVRLNAGVWPAGLAIGLSARFLKLWKQEWNM